MLDDLRMAARSLAKTPAFAVTAVVTLALGIGANTLVFSLAYGVLFRPLPFEAPDRLVSVRATRKVDGIDLPGGASRIAAASVNATSPTASTLPPEAAERTTEVWLELRFR